MTRIDWNFGIRIYSYEPNAYNSDDGGYSASLLSIVDNLRDYMEVEKWTTAEMAALQTTYAMRITFTGIDRAENLIITEKICMGYRLSFESIAIDLNTNHDIMEEMDNLTATGEVVFDTPGTFDIPALPPPVVNTPLQITSNSITISWSAVSGAEGYLLDMATDEAFTQIIINNLDVGNVLSHEIDDLDFGTDYYYRVRSYTDIQVSGNSDVITVSIQIDVLGFCYNWYAVTDSRNIAPVGWHVPTADEFNALITYLGGTDVAGGELKQIGTFYWKTPNTGATNSSGFSACATNIRYYDGTYVNDQTSSFDPPATYQGELAYFYSSTLDDEPSTDNGADALGLEFNGTFAQLYPINHGTNPLNTGLSLRLIKDDSNDIGTMTGNDGKVYPTVKIGTQVWMLYDLLETKYRNGDTIPNISNNNDWAALTSGAYCAYRE